MADVTITLGGVQISSDTVVNRVQAGTSSITSGDAVYLKSSDTKHYPCEVSTGAEEALCVGVAISPTSAADEYFFMATSGTIDMGGTLTIGESYVVSDSGAISAAADLTRGDYGTIVGIATSAALLKLVLSASGVARP